MSPSPVPDRASVAAIETRLREHDDSVAAATAAVRDLQTRRRTVASRLDRLKAAPPAERDDASGSLVDVLAADPGATLDADALAAAVKHRASGRAAREAWEMEVSLVERAAAKNEDEIAAAEARLASLRGDRDGPWGEFVRTAHAHLLDEFVTAFKRLRHELVEPIVALSRATDANGRRIIPPSVATLDEEMTVGLSAIANGSIAKSRLFPRAPGRWSYAAEPVERFRTVMRGEASVDAASFRSREAGDLPLVREPNMVVQSNGVRDTAEIVAQEEADRRAAGERARRGED